MKKGIVYLALVAGLVFNISGDSWGQVYLSKGLGDSGCVDDWENIQLGTHLIADCGRLGVGARVGYFFPYAADGVDSDIAYEILVSYAVNRLLATTLSAGYTELDWNEPVNGKLHMTYVDLTFEMRGEPEPGFAIYFGFGPSLFFNDLNSHEAYSLKAKDGFGLNLSMGLDYLIIHDLAFNIDVKNYFYIEKFKYKVDGVQQKEDFNSAVFSAGLKYFF